MTAQIPVFVSAPTKLSPAQQASYDAIIGLLDNENFERRALGRGDDAREGARTLRRWED